MPRYINKIAISNLSLMVHLVHTGNQVCRWPKYINTSVVCIDEFDDYTCLSVAAGHDQLVPICPLKLAFDFRVMINIIGSREKNHVALDWALTIHKAQGLTFLWIILNLGDSEMQLGTSVVRCSRVKSYLPGIAI